jgi:hypothetical protein
MFSSIKSITAPFVVYLLQKSYIRKNFYKIARIFPPPFNVKIQTEYAVKIKLILNAYNFIIIIKIFLYHKSQKMMLSYLWVNFKIFIFSNLIFCRVFQDQLPRGGAGRGGRV